MIEHALILADTHPGGTGVSHAIAGESLCGLSLLERQLRLLATSAIKTVSILTSDPNQKLIADLPMSVRRKLEIQSFATDSKLALNDVPTLVWPSEYVLDQRLLNKMIAQQSPTLLVDSDPASSTKQTDSVFSGAAILSGSTLTAWRRSCSDNGTISSLLKYVSSLAVTKLDIATLPIFYPQLRRDLRPFWRRLQSPEDRSIAKGLLIDAAQKGSLDIPAKILHAPIENWCISRLCEIRLTPNQITLITNIVAWGTTALLYSGYLLFGLVLAALVGILDGLDGKQARVKLMTSKFGEFEHLFDMLFEYSWWLAIGWALSESAYPLAMSIALALVACNFADTLAQGLFWFRRGKIFGRTLDNYTPFDLWFRKVGGRRNIYIWILLPFALFGQVYTGLWICLLWGLISLCIRWGRTVFHILTAPRESFDFPVN